MLWGHTHLGVDVLGVSLAQYYMKHIPSQGRIGLGSLGLVPGNDLKSRVLQGRNL